MDAAMLTPLQQRLPTLEISLRNKSGVLEQGNMENQPGSKARGPDLGKQHPERCKM